MRIDILTLFPEVFTPLFSSIPLRAQKSGKVQVEVHQLRDWGKGKHRQVDDTPYGGGPGMVMSCPPLYAAIRHIQGLDERPQHAIYLSPQGRRLDQARVMELAALPRLLLLCGHYEGVDERVLEDLIEEEISIGDFVVSGGELPAMLLADAIIRVLPGVIDAQSVEQDSFFHGLLDHPHYTKPAEFEGRRVPDVLISGDHAKIEAWRRQMSLSRTAARRPDLLADRTWTPDRKDGADTLTGSSRAPGAALHRGSSHGQEGIGGSPHPQAPQDH